MSRCLLLVFVVLLTAPAFAEETLPAITPFRYNEDWSILLDSPRRADDPLLRLKAIPLSEDSYLTLGAELRYRYEFLTTDWSTDPQDNDGYHWLRALPVADWHVTKRTRLFAELIAATAFDREPEPSPVDKDDADFLQAFADVELVEEGPTARVGRHVFALGSERLVGTRYGTNVIRAFDTIQLSGQSEPLGWLIFYSRPVEQDTGVFDDHPDDQIQFWGFYTTTDLLKIGMLTDATEAGLDAYYLGLDDEDAEFNQGVGPELRHTCGLRFFGDQDPWFWNHELFLQFGNFRDGDILAWSTAFQAGRRFECLPLRPTFDIKFDVISGDNDPADDRLGTFNPLFPSLKYFGEAAVIAPYNLIDLHPRLSLELTDKLSLAGSIDFFWRYSLDDGLYGPAGVVRPDGGSRSRHISNQYEVVVDYKSTDRLSFSAAYAILPPGDFIRDTGEAVTIHFAGFEMLWVF